MQYYFNVFEWLDLFYLFLNSLNISTFLLRFDSMRWASQPKCASGAYYNSILKCLYNIRISNSLYVYEYNNNFVRHDSSVTFHSYSTPLLLPRYVMISDSLTEIRLIYLSILPHQWSSCSALKTGRRELPGLNLIALVDIVFRSFPWFSPRFE